MAGHSVHAGDIFLANASGGIFTGCGADSFVNVTVGVLCFILLVYEIIEINFTFLNCRN